MTGSPRAVAVVMGLVSGLTALAPAWADAGSLHVQVITVRATGVGPCDDRLVALRPRLRRVSGYRGFELVDDVTRRIPVRTESIILLPGDRVLRLLPKSFVEDVLQLQVRLLAGRRRLVDTNIRMPSGGTMVFGVGPEASAGEEATLFVLKASDIR